MATSANQQQASIYLPAKQTIGNQAIKPVQNQPVTLPQQSVDPVTGRPVDQAGFGMAPSNQSTAVTGVGDSAPTSNNTGGLLGNISMTQPVKPEAPQLNYQAGQYQNVNPGTSPTMTVPTSSYTPSSYQNVTDGLAANAPTANVPTINWTPKEFIDHGYTAEQTKEVFRYDPRAESMVQNQLTGLLDPNSDLMRRAIANANAYSAGRGLQSSSIATGAAQAAMIDRALPIAQQDADTNRQTDQIGWNQSFTAEQNNADRRQQLTAINAQGSVNNQLQNNQLSFQQASQQAQMQMQAEMQELQYLQSLGLLDAQGAQRMQELNAQQGFQAGESQANRQMQAELADLQYRQQMGLLDAQGQQRFQELQEQQRFQGAMQDLQYRQSIGTLDYQGQQQLQQMERSAQLNQQRDVLLQRFNDMNMDKSFLQNLQLTQMQYQQQDSMFEKQVSAQAAADYRNAVSTGYNYYLEQVAAVYGNSNMTPEQQEAGVAKLGQLFEQQRLQLQAIYGFAEPPREPGTGGNPTNPIPGDWNGLPPGNGATPIPSPGGGTGGGGSFIPNTGGGLLDQLTQPVDRISPIINDPSMYQAVR